MNNSTWTLLSIHKQDKKIIEIRRLCRSLETRQYLGSNLDNRGVGINLKTKGNNILLD